MSRPAKPLTPDEETLKGQIAAKFSGLETVPETRTPEWDAAMKQRALEFFQERAKSLAGLSREDRKKLPKLTLAVFPGAVSFAAYMVASLEDSLQTWNRRFQSGSMKVTSTIAAQKKIAAKVKQLSSLVESLRATGMEIPPELAKLLAGVTTPKGETAAS